MLESHDISASDANFWLLCKYFHSMFVPELWYCHIHVRVIMWFCSHTFYFSIGDCAGIDGVSSCLLRTNDFIKNRNTLLCAAVKGPEESFKKTIEVDRLIDMLRDANPGEVTMLHIFNFTDLSGHDKLQFLSLYFSVELDLLSIISSFNT